MSIEQQEAALDAAAQDDGAARRALNRTLDLLARIDQQPALVRIARRLRAMLPGDGEFGDPLSTAGSKQLHMVGRRFAELTAERPGALREAGLSALQLWQALAEAQGRGRGTERLAIVFTDLVEFSAWALRAGDEPSVRLLREVDGVMQQAVQSHDGEVVKRLGDGMMAVFGDPADALDALTEACAGMSDVHVDGYRPRLRAGLHVGRPRRLGGDYLGVDVNVASRLTDEASADEVLISGPALGLLDGAAPGARRKRRFKVKGVPKDLEAYSIALDR
jgi:adenylate cyclase